MEQYEQDEIEYQEGEEDEEKEGIRIHLAEGIFITLLLITTEGIGAILSWATFAGAIISEVINGAVGIAVEIYLFFRGARGARQLAVFGLGIFIDEMDGGFFPTETILWLITWYLINHPKTMEKMGPAAQIAELGK